MLYDDATQLTEALRELFRERCTKKELLHNLSETLNGFPQIKNTIFQHAIIEFIVVHAEDDCEIVLDDEEVRRIWN